MSKGPFVDFAAGDVILREGEAASALYIIDSGHVAIVRDAAPDTALAELGPGDFFGEMSILQEQAHSATVRASSAVRALRIDAAAFHGVLRENAEIGVQLMRRLVLRLQASEQGRRSARDVPTPVNGLAGAPVMPTPAAPPRAAPAPAAAPAPLPPEAPPSAAAPARPDAPPAPPAAAPDAPVAAAPGALALRHAGGDIVLPVDKTELLVGRPDPATGAIPEINLGPLDSARTLSRRHARMIRAGDSWMVREEPGVGNGTWVNGDRLQPEQSASVKVGDTLRFGAIEVKFVRG
jgi:hypothetical protein